MLLPSDCRETVLSLSTAGVLPPSLAERSGLSATARKDTSYPAPTNGARTKKHNSKALRDNIFNCLTVFLQNHMFLNFCEELGMEVGKMPVLVPPSFPAELQSLCAEDSDQLLKKHMENVILVAKSKFTPSSLLFCSQFSQSFLSLLSLMWWAL